MSIDEQLDKIINEEEIVTPPPLPSIRIISSFDGGYMYYLLVECPHCGEPSLPKLTRDVTVELRAGNIHNVSPALDLPPHRSAKDETTQCPGWQGFYRNGKFEAAAEKQTIADEIKQLFNSKYWGGTLTTEKNRATLLAMYPNIDLMRLENSYKACGQNVEETIKHYIATMKELALTTKALNKWARRRHK